MQGPPRDYATPEASPKAPGAKATKHGLSILGAKIFFILSGLLQQALLGRVLGMSGYGALSTALSASSLVYNPVVQSSLQGVSRTVAQNHLHPEQALRRVLRVHLGGAVGVACIFLVGAGPLARALGASHLSSTFTTLSLVLLVYGLYAPLIGALNGSGRLHLQAFFDVLSATLRTVGLVVGAYLGIQLFPSLPSGGALGAASGFVASSAIVLVIAGVLTGTGEKGGTSPTSRQYLGRLLPLFFGQFLLNILFQADALLLRRFAASAALAEHGSEILADPFVGAYRAAQLFSFLPYQLLSSVTLVLFPLLARAQSEQDGKTVALYVAQGMRLSLVALGAMLSVLIAFPSALLRLVYGADAAMLGAPALTVLGPSLGLLAVLGVLTTCLNGLGQERKTMMSMFVAVLTVLVAATVFTRSVPLGSELLVRTALGTGLALLLATGVAGWFLYKEVGAWVRIPSVARILLTIALAGALGRALQPDRTWLVVPLSAVVFLVYVGGLIALGEIGKADLASFRARSRRSG
jgi:stage V sporulation protein B